eukprot:6190241-Pleurochrysis_carterae.AAC.1
MSTSWYLNSERRRAQRERLWSRAALACVPELQHSEIENFNIKGSGSSTFEFGERLISDLVDCKGASNRIKEAALCKAFQRPFAFEAYLLFWTVYILNGAASREPRACAVLWNQDLL